MHIGVRAEDKNAWERRVPLIPKDIEVLRRSGISICVQSSGQRAYTDQEFKGADVPVVEDLKDAPLIVGLKEIPEERLEPDKIYFIFSHVIKGQAYNMPMLKRMMALGNTLVDYERIVDEENRRLIFFGRHAGIAGMIQKRVPFSGLEERLLWYDALPYLGLSRFEERRLLASLTTMALPGGADAAHSSGLARADALAAAGHAEASLTEITKVYEAGVEAFERENG
jgi:hypothetical protein